MRLISYSTIGFIDRDVEAALDAIAAAGFDQAEILGQEPHVAILPKGKTLVEFRKRIEGRGLSVSVHTPMKHNVLGAPDEEWRLKKVKVLKSYIRFAGAIDAKELIVHPVPNPIFVPEPEDPALPAFMLNAARRSLDELIPMAQKSNVRILLENLPYQCKYPLLTMRELRPFIEGYPQEFVGLVVDTGHAAISGDDPAMEVHIAGDRLYGVHLHDTDTDLSEDFHWIPTHGSLDWDAIRSSLVKVKYNGPWTFEVCNGRHKETPDELAAACCRIAKKWQKHHHS